MKAAIRIAAFALLALIVLTFVPQAAEYRFEITVAELVLAALLVVLLLAGRAGPADAPRVEAPPVTAAPVPQTKPAVGADAEVVAFLASLQDKGRLVDFLMDDITAYADAQVGAAARVVHAGCKAVLHEHFGIRPVRDEAEGSVVGVAKGYAADEYRLVGRIQGEAPFTGTLVHRGWRVEWVKLARVLRQDDRLPTIAPAEVELK